MRHLLVGLLMFPMSLAAQSLDIAGITMTIGMSTEEAIRKFPSPRFTIFTTAGNTSLEHQVRDAVGFTIGNFSVSDGKVFAITSISVGHGTPRAQMASRKLLYDAFETMTLGKNCSTFTTFDLYAPVPSSHINTMCTDASTVYKLSVKSSVSQFRNETLEVVLYEVLVFSSKS